MAMMVAGVAFHELPSFSTRNLPWHEGMKCQSIHFTEYGVFGDGYSSQTVLAQKRLRFPFFIFLLPEAY
jgi:hypothetical protein